MKISISTGDPLEEYRNIFVGNTVAYKDPNIPSTEKCLHLGKVIGATGDEFDAILTVELFNGTTITFPRNHRDWRIGIWDYDGTEKEPISYVDFERISKNTKRREKKFLGHIYPFEMPVRIGDRVGCDLGNVWKLGVVKAIGTPEKSHKEYPENMIWAVLDENYSNPSFLTEFLPKHFGTKLLPIPPCSQINHEFKHYSELHDATDLWKKDDRSKLQFIVKYSLQFLAKFDQQLAKKLSRLKELTLDQERQLSVLVRLYSMGNPK